MTRFEKMKPALDILFSDLSMEEFIDLAGDALDSKGCYYCGIDKKYCDHMMAFDDPDHDKKYPFGNGVSCRDVIQKYLQQDIVNHLPSAQPEIIRCKDCKYRMPYEWMFSETWRSQNINDYSEDEIGCEYCDMAMKADDFCSRAERRTDG